MLYSVAKSPKLTTHFLLSIVLKWPIITAISISTGLRPDSNLPSLHSGPFCCANLCVQTCSSAQSLVRRGTSPPPHKLLRLRNMSVWGEGFPLPPTPTPLLRNNLVPRLFCGGLHPPDPYNVRSVLVPRTSLVLFVQSMLCMCGGASSPEPPASALDSGPLHCRQAGRLRGPSLGLQFASILFKPLLLATLVGAARSLVCPSISVLLSRLSKLSLLRSTSIECQTSERAAGLRPVPRPTAGFGFAERLKIKIAVFWGS